MQSGDTRSVFSSEIIRADRYQLLADLHFNTFGKCETKFWKIRESL